MAKRKTSGKIKPAAQLQYVRPPTGALRVLAYILSVISPVVGFIFGIVFYSQEGTENKSFGKVCFILMGISVVLIIGFIFLMMIFNAVLGGAGLTEMNIQEGYY